jgi:transcriptional regulator with XRE-family HTH domain
MLTQQIVEALTAERKRRGLLQRDVAERMGCHTTFVQVFEYIKRDPRLSTVERYAAALGVELEVSIRSKE